MTRQTSLGAAIVGAILAMAAAGAANAAAIDINGGTSWAGWDARGSSLGAIYGKGSTTRDYGLYTSVFTFNNNTFDSSSGGVQVKNDLAPAGFAAGAHSTGAFTNGHTILGIGLDLNGSASAVGTTFVTFGLGGNNFQAATSLGGIDGRTSDGSNQWEHAGDLSMWMDGTTANGPSNLAAWTSNGTQHGGSGASSNLPGGIGGGVSYDYAFREFRQGTAGGSIQMFFDVDAMQSLYGVGGTYSAAIIGAFGSGFNVSMFNSDANFANSNQVTFGVDLPAAGAAVPEPGSLALVALALLGLGAARRRKTA